MLNVYICFISVLYSTVTKQTLSFTEELNILLNCSEPRVGVEWGRERVDGGVAVLST